MCFVILEKGEIHICRLLLVLVGVKKMDVIGRRILIAIAKFHNASAGTNLSFVSNTH